MIPNPDFVNRPNNFWAIVKYASELLGYSNRLPKNKGMKTYKREEFKILEEKVNISNDLVSDVLIYLNYRNYIIEKNIAPLLMNRDQAKQLFEHLRSIHNPKCMLRLNKQRADKRHFNYLSCIVNILVEAYLKGKTFCDNPRGLSLITDKDNKPAITLSRWMDGAYPTIHNPIAIWEIKEYYGTTTFGSRVADGVYETQLDGYELLEAEKILGKKIEHYLFVDDNFTWWIKGKSYLCRLIDMMHIGLVDEVIFGREVATRWPEIVKKWP
ncbi:MAG: hypothetical protein COS90_11630 [Deltaproteobacteria bacterium CG07_land_8_20_14_0_80_60_11]|nr:MAG: hypothetical protein COS90_11630 [Deltaproteobacteria bacterium CG07_land_8_20_14_0_80_60_11]